MFHRKKLGKVFTPCGGAERPWMREFAQAPSALVFDDFVRIYLSCRAPADESVQYTSRCAFVDLDRADLFKIQRLAREPVLDLGGTGEFDEFGTYPISVIRNGD